MTTNPLFSIATVTLNNLGGLRKTHASIAQQSCTNFEWLVQDGGSTDGSLEFLNTLAPSLHALCAESMPDKGIYHAMNRLIDRATGKYILFLNAGDALANPKTLEKISKTLNQHLRAGGDLPLPIFLYGDAFEDISVALHLKKAKPHTAIKTGMFTHHQSMLYNRNAIGTLRYNLAYTIAADYDFTARFLHHVRQSSLHGSSVQSTLTNKVDHTDKPCDDCAIIYIPQPLCIFESGGVSQTNAVKGRKEQYQIRKTLKLCAPLTNKTITALQALNWQIRRLFPRLYWFLKSH